MTGDGRIWRRCFKIASETVKCSPKCRGITRINVAIRRTFVYQPLYMYSLYIFHQSCRFFNEFTVSGTTGTSYWQWWLAQKLSGSNAAAPNTNSLFFGLPSSPSYFPSSSFHPSPSSSTLHFVFHYTLFPKAPTFLKTVSGQDSTIFLLLPFLLFPL
jgi:hypothetical protein